MKVRVLFLGTPEFACPTLHALLEEQNHFEVVGVVTQPDRPAGRNLNVQASRVKEMAEGHLATLSKITKKFPVLTPENVNDPAVLKQLFALTADVAVVVAYGQILSTPFL